MITCGVTDRWEEDGDLSQQTRASRHTRRSDILTLFKSLQHLFNSYYKLSSCNNAANSVFLHHKRVFFHLPGNPVDVKFDHVLPTGVVLGFSSSVLRVDDAVNTHTHTHVIPSVERAFAPIFRSFND